MYIEGFERCVCAALQGSNNNPFKNASLGIIIMQLGSSNRIKLLPLSSKTMHLCAYHQLQACLADFVL